MSDDESLGGWSIESAVIEKIDDILDEGDTILEFGSGYGTGQLAERYEMVSLEQNEEWVGEYDSEYIYAPLDDGWFDRDAIRENLDSEYDLILVDGPKGKNRANFPEHSYLFNLDVPMIFDDVNRETDREAAVEMSDMVDREMTIYDGRSKQFAVV